MPVKIFFCYAHEDETLLNTLKTHLKPLQRQGFINIWYDRDISAGTEWESEIDEHLNTAQIILLLVSPDFLASDYCYSVEMKLALERHKRREARVIPVILRTASWQGILGNLQALPTDAKPVIGSSWHDLDEAFFNVADGIRKAAIDMAKRSPIDLVEKPTPPEKPTYPSDFQEDGRPSSTERPALPKLILHSLGKQPVFPIEKTQPIPSVPLTMQPIPPPPAAPRFEMATYLVTNREFKEFLDANPGWQPGERFRYEKEVDSHYLSHWSKERTEYPADLAEYPVVNVSSYAAQAYAAWRGGKLRKSLRLPLKDEWEFAARAGRSSWNETLMEELYKDQVRVNYDYIAEEGMTPVGTFEQNPYGLYDLLGNVYELCFPEANMIYACGGAYYSPREQLTNPLHLKPRECHRYVGFRYVHDLSNH